MMMLVGHFYITAPLGMTHGKLNAAAFDEEFRQHLQLKAGHLSRNVVTVTSDDPNILDALMKIIIATEVL
jgi:hypothetical protein